MDQVVIVDRLGDETSQLLQWGGVTTPWIDFPSSATMSGLVMESARRHSTSKAVEDDGEHSPSGQPERLSYDELAAKVTRLARALVCTGARSGDRIAVVTHRCVAMVVAVLGIQEAGCSFVAIDPKHPIERIVTVLQDCGAKLCVCMDKVLTEPAQAAASFEATVVLGNDGEVVQLGAGHVSSEQLLEASELRSNQECYMFYTSGSTGKPKGVIVEHRNVVNQLFHFQESFKLGPGSTVMAITTLTFDPCILEIFWPLAFGASVMVASTSTQRNGSKMLELLETTHPNILQATPTMFSILNSFGWEGNPATHILSGGEAFPQALLPEVQNCKSFSNVYGPTETTVWATHFHVKTRQQWAHIDTSQMPVGRPLTNYSAFLLNKEMQLVPVMELGELYIGGAGMTRGYHNRPEQNKAAFATSPFAALSDPKFEGRAPRGDLLYKTGDLMMWNEGGQLLYMGRSDNQVKINGHRMELGEIEVVLEKHEEVKRAIVLVKEISGTRSLLGYYQPKNGSQISQMSVQEAGNKLQSFASGLIPKYMVPTMYVQINDWPTNTSGKIARGELPMPDVKHDAPPCADSSALSLQDISLRVKSCLENVTGQVVDERTSLLAVGIDSVLGVTFTKMVSESTGVPITGKDMLQCETIADLAELIHTRRNGAKTTQLQRPLTPALEMHQMMDRLSGLRGATILFVFYDHFHMGVGNHDANWVSALFNHPPDMHIFFIITGLVTAVQHHSMQFSLSSIGRFWWNFYKKAFPMYYLAVVCMIPTSFIVRGWGVNDTSAGCVAMIITGTQIWDPDCNYSFLNLDSAGWFVSCLWQLMLLFPLIYPLLPKERRSSLLATIVLVLLNFTATRFLVSSDFIEWAFGEAALRWWGGWGLNNLPVVRVATFLTGACLGNLLHTKVMNGGNHAKELPWATINNISGVLLLVTTFAPSIRYVGNPWRSPTVEYMSVPCKSFIWYPTEIDKNVILSIQFIVIPVFIYSCCYGKGTFGWALQAPPLQFIGRYVFPFYLFQISMALCMGYKGENVLCGHFALMPVKQLWALPVILWTVFCAYLIQEYYLTAVHRAIDLLASCKGIRRTCLHANDSDATQEEEQPLLSATAV